MIFRGLGVVSRSSRRCFLVSSRRTGRIKSLAGTCRHFHDQWYISVQSPHVLHIEKVIRGKERRNGIDTLRDFTARLPSTFDKSNTRRLSRTATESKIEDLRPSDCEYTKSKLESIHRQAYDAFLYSGGQRQRTPTSPNQTHWDRHTNKLTYLPWCWHSIYMTLQRTQTGVLLALHSGLLFNLTISRVVCNAVIELKPSLCHVWNYQLPAPPTSLIPPWLLVNKRSSVKRHSLHVGLGRHRLARIAHLAQQLEVVDVKCRCRSEEQLRLLIRRVGEGMRRPDGHRHIITDVCVDDFFVFARVVRVRDVEADGALCDVEGLVVHFVPVRWRTGRFGWERELDGSEAVVCGFRGDV